MSVLSRVLTALACLLLLESGNPLARAVDEPRIATALGGGSTAAEAESAAEAAATAEASEPAESPAETLARLIAAWQAPPDARAMPVENLSMPIDRYANGRTRAQLKAARALVPAKGGYIRASDVLIELYDTTGRMDGVFVADNCIYDRDSTTGYCDGKVRIERLQLRITGSNMVWNSSARSAKILSQAEVRTSQVIKGMEGLFK